MDADAEVIWSAPHGADRLNLEPAPSEHGVSNNSLRAGSQSIPGWTGEMPGRAGTD